MRKATVIVFLGLILGLTNCKSRDSISLSIALEKIKHIESASYNSTNYFCYSGDTIPLDEKSFEYFKEYTLLSDTSVGASYVKFELKDTTKMIFAYDGNIKARINWKDYSFQTNDFSKNPWPYRTVLAPFFAKSKALIEYALNTDDSLRIDSIVYETAVAYKISILNERIELVGRLPIHITELGSNEGVISEYVLWVNRKTKLPFKFQRTLPDNTMVEEISNFRMNHLNSEGLIISNYIPSDMPQQLKNRKYSTEDLINTVAYNYNLKDLKGQFHNLEEVSSKVYMINLTSIFCGACKMSEPYLKGLNKKYNKKDFSFISLYDEKEKKGLLKYANDKELNYDVLLIDKQIQEAYKLNVLPTFLILDKYKIIKKIIYGFGKGKTDIEIEKAIEKLL